MERVNLEINLRKKYLCIFGSLFLFLAGVGFVYSFGGSEPLVLGHDSGEIRFDENTVNVSAINFESPDDMVPFGVISGAQKKIVGSCAGSCVTGIDEDGNVLCSVEKPINIGMTSLSFETREQLRAYPSGCVDVKVDCGSSGCKVFWEKVGYGTNIKNFGETSISRGETVESQKYRIADSIKTADYSCVVKWDESSNKIMLYGMMDYIPSYNGHNYVTLQRHSYKFDSVNWYIP